MVSAGRWSEHVSATMLPCVNTKSTGVYQQDKKGHRIFNKGINEFRELICSSSAPLKDSFLSDLGELQKIGNVLNLCTPQGKQFAAHMTYSV